MMTLNQDSKKGKYSDLMLSLARCMAGDFSNKQQATADPQNYAHIRVFFRPLPLNFFSGIGFYSEQFYNYDLWDPYRQGVHRFVDQGDQIYVENYQFKDAVPYAGAGRNSSILNSITPDVIERRLNCSMIFRQEGDIFKGGVEPGNNCLISRNGCQTYLVSEVEFTENTFVGWDRGRHIDTHEHIWGSAIGPLKFEKIQSFAEEIPQ